MNVVSFIANGMANKTPCWLAWTVLTKYSYLFSTKTSHKVLKDIKFNNKSIGNDTNNIDDDDNNNMYPFADTPNFNKTK